MKPHNTVMSHLAAYRPEEAAPLESPIRAIGGAAVAEPAANGVARERRLREMVDSYVGFVARVLRNAGTPEAEIDDEVQRTFITASRRLDDIRLGAEKAFLFRIALNLAAHARRTAARRREVPADKTPERVETLATPEQLTDRKRMRMLLDRVLDQMHETLRSVFVLREFEEMNMSEIAVVLNVPRGTVASRLRRARAEFRERVRALEDGEERGNS